MTIKFDAEVPVAEEQLAVAEEQLKVIFKKLDKNGDGKLSKEEVTDAFKKMGSKISNWRSFWAMFHADTNSDGFITLDEMEPLIKYVRKVGFTAREIAAF